MNYVNSLYRAVNNFSEENYTEILANREIIEKDLHLQPFPGDLFKSSPIERLRIIAEDINGIKDDIYANIDPEASANYLAMMISDNTARMLMSAYNIAVAINDSKADSSEISQVVDSIQQFNDDMAKQKDEFELAKQYSRKSEIIDNAIITLAKISEYSKELHSKYNAKPELSGMDLLKPILGNAQSLGVSLSTLLIDTLQARAHFGFIKIGFGLALGFFGIITSIAFVYMIIIGVAEPISLVTDAMEKFANGDITAQLPVYDRRDEVGKMTIALTRFHSTLVEREKLIEEKRVHNIQEEKRAQAIFVLNKEFEKLTRESLQIFAGASEELNITAKSMAEAANVASQRSAVVASASEEISHNINSVASSSKGLVTALQVIGSQMETSQKTTKICCQ